MAGVRLISLKDKLEQRDNYVTEADLEFKDFDENNKVLFNKLFIDDSKYKLISSSPKIFSAIHKDDFGRNFYISEAEMDYYISGFLQSVKDNVEDILDKSVADGAEDDLNKAALDDEDIKLSLYRSFKSLYDKWISKSENKETSGYFFNNYNSNNEVKDERMLFDHFSFVTRGGTDIGGVAVIDVSYLSNLANKQTGQGPTQSLYQSLTDLLGKNNFDFFALPSLIPYSTKDPEELKDIFRAFDGPIIVEPAKPGFVCLFVGGSSRTLEIPQSYCNKSGISFEYVNDSFDINDPLSYPEDIVNNGGITAFLIKYGQEAQNHFLSVQLDQTEFKETQESLMVIDALMNPKTGSQPSQAGKGNNIYDSYLTRSYSCSVETLGNMMIQPLMYFKLENVPMFRGTYLIKNVSHEIKPHNVKTTFVGVRQPIVTVPIVRDAISLLDLSLANVEETAGSSGGGLVNVSADQIFAPPTDVVFEDNSNKTCPENTTDAGVADGYKKGNLIKIKLCKVSVPQQPTINVNADIATNVFNLLTEAANAGILFTGFSGFRTMQAQLDAGKANGCNPWPNWTSSRQCTIRPTAPPGFSNHQMGLAIDFKQGGGLINKSSSGYKWLVQNANKYGLYNWPVEDWHWSVDGK